MERTLRRFYREVALVPATGADGRGHGIALDGRPLRTPMGAALRLPRHALAEAVAAEWQAQDETVIPAEMPMTRLANSAIDRVAPRREAVIDEIAAYGRADLLCHRAEAPRALAERQAAAWEPLLAWAAARFGARLCVTAGVMPLDHRDEDLAALRAAIAAYDSFALAGLHQAASLTGSVVIALALAEGRLTPDQAWAAARIDEDFQIAHWGEDAEAAARAERMRAELDEAVRFLHLARGEGDD